MSLIPGTLPSDSCFGTPQEVLELFAQYLDIPAFAVSSKVLYSDTSPLPSTDFIWVDTTGSQNNVLKIYNTIASTYQEYPLAGTAGSPNTLIDGKSTIPSALTSSDKILVSKAGVLYRATLAQLAATGKIAQVVEGSSTTPTTNSASAWADTGLTVSITPTSSSNKVLILIAQPVYMYNNTVIGVGAGMRLLRNSTTVYAGDATNGDLYFSVNVGNAVGINNVWASQYLDSPSSSSSLVYKTQFFRVHSTDLIMCQRNNIRSSIVAIEVTP
jgi:hypothetical protein